MLLRVPSIWLKLLLVATLLVLLLSGVSRMVFMQMRLLHGCLIPPRFGQMVAWSWTRSLVFLLLVLVCVLTCLFTAGVAAGGAMLIVFSRIVLLILVEVLCLSLVLCRLYRGLSCGGHS